MKTCSPPVLITFSLLCFALIQNTGAVSPPPDGGYAGANTAEGDNALLNLTTGTGNTANGNSALSGNTTGSANTASGDAALGSNTTGFNNTANGAGALFSNTTGSYNTATGHGALDHNTTGEGNTANGDLALDLNYTGNENTANGAGALERNTTGSNNTANGALALETNSTGSNNTANGHKALDSNNFGNNNTAIGFQALFSNSAGSENTATGDGALFSNTTANFNTATGFNALLNNTTGQNNIALGYQAGQQLTTGSNNIDIGNGGVAAESNTIRIGKVGSQTKTVIAGINGATVASGVGVIVGSSGQLGTVVSSERFKDQVKPMDKASEVVLALKPVTFRYKKELDPDGIPQFGLVAEEVAKVNPALVARDAKGQVYTVRYDAVNAMLLNEFLKEHRKVQEQEARVTQLKKDFRATVAQLATRLNEQAAQIQKVSAQLEASKPAQQVVNNP